MCRGRSNQPFDPSTPSSQQAVGQFSGLIELLAPCPDASAQEGDLCPLTAGLDMVELVLSDLESSVAVGRLNPGEGGRFLFGDLTGGRMRIDISAPGFRLEVCPDGVLCAFTEQAGQFEFTLAIGQSFELTGPVRLVRIPVAEEPVDQTSWVEGRVLLDGVPSDVEAHGGSIVEQVNNPEVVRVASDGRFRLRVIPGAVVSGSTPWLHALVDHFGSCRTGGDRRAR